MEKGLLILFVCLYLVFSFVGGIYVHELTHKYDFRKLEVEEDKICVLINCSWENVSALGHYKYFYDASNETQNQINEEINSYTEKHAYFAQGVFQALTIVGLILFLAKKI